MKFGGIYKLVVYALVVVGLAPLALSGEVPFPFVLLVYGLVAASWFYRPPERRSTRGSRLWTLALFALLGVFALLGAGTGNWLLYAILFAMVMVVARLYQGRTPRDIFQLYGLTFVAMIAGAVVNPAMSFLFSFVIYVVLLTWALVLLHLHREIDRVAQETRDAGELESDQSWRTRRLVTPRFLLGSSSLALLIFVGSLLFFFFFPRLGMGFFFGQGRGGQSMSGFSDKIELGHFGTIKDNMAVVMRVEFPEQVERTASPLRMRGISFDHYDGRVWSKTTHKHTEMPQRGEGTWALSHFGPSPAPQPGERRVVQEVYLEPLNIDRRMIFGEPRIVTVSIDNARLDRLKRDRTIFYQDIATDISTGGRTDTALRYTVESRTMSVPEEMRAADEGPIPEWVRDLYLQLPRDLDPRIAELSREVTKDATSIHAKVRAIERHLRRNYRYSTEGGHDRRNPLGSFLFDRKAGHCEYFASAMVIMLRTVGVPARTANGFYGGAYNDYGGYYQIRQADAHSWVEAFYPSYGWLTYDPTPPAVLVPAEDGFWASLSAWFDSLKLKWYKWVVEYDLEKQLSFFKEIGRGLRNLFGGDESERTSEAEDDEQGGFAEAFVEALKRWQTWAFLGVPLILLLLWRFGVLRALRRWWRRRRSRSRTEPAGVARVYAQMLRVLARQGLARAPEETPSELAVRLRSSGHPGASEVEAITRAFEAERYGQRGASPEAVAAASESLDRLRRAG